MTSLKKILLDSSRKHGGLPLILLGLLGTIAFVPFIGSVHLFDLDEVIFAEITREMIVSQNYSQVQLNFMPFYEKPPLFFWIQGLSMQWFGINEFGARFPNAFFGLLTLLTLYLIGGNYKNRFFGILWALMHLSAFLPHLYFKSGIIDPVFNYFIFLGVYFLSRVLDISIRPLQRHYAICSGFWIGLAMLTKGPVGILIPMLTVVVYFFLWKPTKYSFTFLLLILITSLLLPIGWSFYEMHQHGYEFFKRFISYQIGLFSKNASATIDPTLHAIVTAHDQPFYYHFVVVFLGCFPASVLAIGEIYTNVKKKSHTSPTSLLNIMKSLLMVVMVLFTLVSTKIVHYSSMAYFPITFLAAHYLYYLYHHIIPVTKILNISWLCTGLFIAGLLIILPLFFLFQNHFSHCIKNELVHAALTLPVSWSFGHCFIGIGYLLAVIIGYLLLKRLAIILFTLCMSLTTTICLSLLILCVVPKIEHYSQGIMIEFCKSIRGKPVYLTTIDFMGWSCAHLFYTQQNPENCSRSKNQHWLLTGAIDKPAYFIIRTKDMSMMAHYPDIMLIKKAGCFAFYVRDTVTTK